MFFEKDNKTYLALLGSRTVFNVTDDLPIKFEETGLAIPEQRFGNSSYGHMSGEFDGKKYVSVWNGHGGKLYQLVNGEPSLLFKHPRLDDPQFIRVGGKNLLVSSDGRQLYVREVALNKPDLIIPRENIAIGLDQVTVYEDEGRLFTLFRESMGSKNWKVARMDLETREKATLGIVDYYNGGWGVLTIRGIPHAYFVRGDALVFVNLRTMRIEDSYASTALSVTHFSVGGMLYVLNGAKIIDVEGQQVTMSLPFPENTNHVSTVFYQGEQYAFIIPFRRPPLLLRLTKVGLQ